ncbi:MAG: hypothetical protein WC620_03560 [Methanoregula sp.]
MKRSEHTSMIIIAFCFMVLMLIITAPSAGPGLVAGMDPGNPVSGHYSLTQSPLIPDPPLPVAGPDNTSFLAWLNVLDGN